MSQGTFRGHKLELLRDRQTGASESDSLNRELGNSTNSELHP